MRTTSFTAIACRYDGFCGRSLSGTASNDLVSMWECVRTMGKQGSPQENLASKREHAEALLDEGLNETFPASDPVAVSFTGDSAADTNTAAERAVAAWQASDAREKHADRNPALKPRLDYWKFSPQGVAAFRHLNSYVEGCGLEHSLLELVKTRASQINGCAYCLDMHTKDARAAGEKEQRLYPLSAWREAPFFSARERAAARLDRSGDSHFGGTGRRCSL